MHATQLESDTKLLIDRSLENLGWVLSGEDKNVFYAHPKTSQEERSLRGKQPDYVLYSKDNSKPLIVIEAKRPGERIDKALEQGISFANILGAPLVFATDGVFCKSYHTFANRVPVLNGEDVDEFIREVLALRFLTNYEVNTVSPKVQYDRKELINIFDEANNMLRGAGLRAGIERFSEFANILFLKLISEIENHKKERGEITNFDPECNWDTIKKITPSARIDYINTNVYKRLNALYKTEIFTTLNMQDESILGDIMNKLDPLMLTDVDSDVKGDAFEYFLKASASTKNDLGEYFTPRHIVKTMVRLVNPQIGEKIYDPFCGTGGFLIESFKYIHNNMARTNENIQALKESTLYGNEITNTARITKMNMILTGDGHNNICMRDSLANPVDGNSIFEDEQGKKQYNGYDIVLANMPYSQKTKHGKLYPLRSENGDSTCVQHCIQAIRSTADNGRMALVVPEGFLFRKDLTETREFLLENCQLQSIISLPPGVFLPYTGVKTNIIYATKVNSKINPLSRKDNFWYFEVKNDGYSLDNHRRKLGKHSDLQTYEEFRKLDEDQSQNMLKVGFEQVPFEKVRANHNILVGGRYRELEISSAHDIVKFEDIATLYRGVMYNRSNQSVVKTKNIVLPADNINLDGELQIKKMIYLDEELEISNDQRLKKDDIFICTSSGSMSHIGKVAYIKEDTNYYAGGFMGIIRTNPEKCLPKYLYYYLFASSVFRNEIKKLAQGASINNISSTINEIKIPLPSIEQQSQILQELESYQKIIQGAKTIINNYKPIIPDNIMGEQKKLEDIAEFNPSKAEVLNLPKKTVVSFIPMSDVNMFNKTLNLNKEKSLEDVAKGYRYFQDNDILLAKITPCFENGKAAIANNLKNGIGFGSTEFIVIRANKRKVYPEWIFYTINTKEFIGHGKRFMTGTAGQRRVDIDFVKQYPIKIPSLKEQKVILSRIREEEKLINKSMEIVKVFSQKIKDRIAEVWGDDDEW